jgi:hypothetical protein
MQYHLAGIHWLDALTPPMEEHLYRLADQVQSCLGQIPQPPPPRSWREKHRNLVRTLCASVILICLSATAFYFLVIRRPQAAAPEGRGAASIAEPNRDDSTSFHLGLTMGVLNGVCHQEYRERNLAWALDLGRGVSTARALMDRLRYDGADSFQSSYARWVWYVSPGSRHGPRYHPPQVGELDFALRFMRPRYGDKVTYEYELGRSLGGLLIGSMELDLMDSFGVDSLNSPRSPAHRRVILELQTSLAELAVLCARRGALPADLVRECSLTVTSDMTSGQGRYQFRRGARVVAGRYGLGLPGSDSWPSFDAISRWNTDGVIRRSQWTGPDSTSSSR